jgi:hypothetical protein
VPYLLKQAQVLIYVMHRAGLNNNISATTFGIATPDNTTTNTGIGKDDKSCLGKIPAMFLA